MPADIKRVLKSYRANAFQISPHLHRAKSYLNGLMKNSFDLQPFHSPKKLKIQTIGIGEYNVDFSSYNELLRFKCDKKNVALLIAKTWGLKQNWTVDFNGSLDRNLLAKIYYRVMFGQMFMDRATIFNKPNNS